MTATSCRIAPEHTTSTVAALLANYETSSRRGEVGPILADALMDAGCSDAELLHLVRTGRYQITEEGARIVTVGRDGADHYSHGGIYTTKVYEAVRRARDGRLTWRLDYSVSYHRTAGKTVSGAMRQRAEDYAAEHGLPVCPHVTHGTECI